MKKIAIITNEIKDKDFRYTAKVIKILKNMGCTILLPKKVENEDITILYDDGDNIAFLPETELYQSAEIIIVLGGDGSIIHTATKAAFLGIPVLGINLGKIGYLAELEENEIININNLFLNNYEIESRMLLEIEYGGGKYYALNDAVIAKSGTSRVIDLRLICDGNVVGEYRADGIIISTPTGSTAYTMSAGGSVIDPKLECISSTPICPHSLTARPIIFAPNSVIEVENICDYDKSVALTVDGEEITKLEINGKVKIRKSEISAKLIRIKKDSFYNTLRSKMKEN